MLQEVSASSIDPPEAPFLCMEQKTAPPCFSLLPAAPDPHVTPIHPRFPGDAEQDRVTVGTWLCVTMAQAEDA